VVPVFNEEEGIAHFHMRLTRLMASIPEKNFEVIYVDDGSADESKEIIRGLLGQASGFACKLVSLSRNFGHQAAIECGMRLSRGDAIVTIDADLQDPPEVIALMVEKFDSGFDVVLAHRLNRKGESIFKKFTAKLWYLIIDFLSDVKLSRDVGDFRLLSRKALDSLLSIQEASPYYRGLVSWIGFRSTTVDYIRDARFAGKTKYTLAKMWNLALSGLTNFSLRPLRIPFFASLITLPIALILTIFLIYEKFVSSVNAVPGYTSIVIILLWSFGIQMFTLGVIGEYLAKNFVQSKSRPRFLVADAWDS